MGVVQHIHTYGFKLSSSLHVVSEEARIDLVYCRYRHSIDRLRNSLGRVRRAV